MNRLRSPDNSLFNVLLSEKHFDNTLPMLQCCKLCIQPDTMDLSPWWPMATNV